MPLSGSRSCRSECCRSQRDTPAVCQHQPVTNTPNARLSEGATANAAVRVRRPGWVLGVAALGLILVSCLGGIAWGQRHPVVHVDETTCLALESQIGCTLPDGWDIGVSTDVPWTDATGSSTKAVALSVCHRRRGASEPVPSTGSRPLAAIVTSSRHLRGIVRPTSSHAAVRRTPRPMSGWAPNTTRLRVPHGRADFTNDESPYACRRELGPVASARAYVLRGNEAG